MTLPTVTAAGGPDVNILGGIYCPACNRRLWVRIASAEEEPFMYSMRVNVFADDGHQLLHEGGIVSVHPNEGCPFRKRGSR